MILRTSSIPGKVRNAFTLGRHFTALAGLLALGTLFTSVPANAQPVHFRYVGGRWSHHWHSGWHRYWGGPTIGFYFAPAPVYVVPGYAAPSYYTGPDFWYSNPSFGLSLNFGGGGGYYGGGHYYGRSVHRWNGGGWHGGVRHGGGWHGGGHFNHGGHRR